MCKHVVQNKYTTKRLIKLKKKRNNICEHYHIKFKIVTEE